MQRSNILAGLFVIVVIMLATVWFVRRSGMESVMDAPAERSAPEDPVVADLEVGANERRVTEFLAEAQRVELRSEQLGEFENTLREVRADPKQVRAWLLAKRYEKSLPLFSSTEKALMTCLKGLDRDPKACAPTAEFRRLLDEAVAAGDLPKGEADRYLNELSLLRDPRTRPAMPKGTAGFMEKESAMKVRNMEAIAAVVRRVDAAALLKPEEK